MLSFGIMFFILYCVLCENIVESDGEEIKKLSFARQLVRERLLYYLLQVKVAFYDLFAAPGICSLGEFLVGH